MKFDRSRFIARFVAEAREHLDLLSKELLHLEARPDDAALVAEIKRAAHTLKGSARMLKFNAMSQVAHRSEDVFIAVMERKLQVSSAVTDLLLRAVDWLRSAVDLVASGGEEPVAPAPLLASFDAAMEGRLPAGATPPTVAPSAPTAAPVAPPAAVLPPPAVVAAPSAEPGAPEAPAPTAEATAAAAAGPTEGSTDWAAAPYDEASAGPSAPEPAGSREPAVAVGETLRVNVSDLDRLVSAVGEAHLEHLVQQAMTVEVAALTRSVVLAVGTERWAWEKRELAFQLRGILDSLGRLADRRHQLARTLTVLLEEAQALRMVPLEGLFESFLRPARDLALSLGKRVRVETSGGEMRLDKQIVDQLHGPLLHLVNNSVDHGLESPEARRSAGKDEVGRIRITARGLSGAVEIVIEDDGGGVDGAALVASAVRKGQIDARRAAELPYDDALQLVFLPGLSSAKLITEVSGRGVGMDVVKRTVEEALKGSVRIASHPGRGTRITLRLPLTLSSRRVFLARAAGHPFAIPLSAVECTVPCGAGAVIDVAGRRAVRVDNQFVPVVDAAELLGFERAGSAVAATGLVLTSGNDRLAVLVDDVVDEREVLIKPLPTLLEGLRDVGGVTFGDRGEAVPVLYVPDVVERARRRERAGTAAGRGTRSAVQAGGGGDAASGARQVRRVLVVDDSFNTREVQRHLLEAHGYAVVLACDGVEALERLATEQVDLVVTDVEMPRMDGFELVTRIRAGAATAALPVVIVTSRETDGDRRRGLEVGANAYIVKRSFDEQKLTATLETLLA